MGDDCGVLLFPLVDELGSLCGEGDHISFHELPCERQRWTQSYILDCYTRVLSLFKHVKVDEMDINL